jgi:carboxyl-terminal processing protease
LLATQAPGAAAQHAAIRTALALVRDPDLHLLSPGQFAALQAETQGRRLGLGLIDFGIDRASTGEARIVATLDGSPARRAGLRPKDLIVAIDGAPTRALDHEAILERLRAEGPHRLQVRRGARLSTATLSSSDAPFPAVVCETRQAGGVTLGYIRVAQFTPDAAKQVRAGLASMQADRPAAYILDLRDNPGGLLDEAADIAGLFRPGDPGAKVRRDGSVEPIQVRSGPIAPGPLAVLIDAGSASAAEFVAGALQGQPGVRLVGAPTRGRGQAQAYAALDDGWGLVIPSARLRSREGAEFKDRPLQPDIEVAEASAPPRTTPDDDPTYRRALAVLAGLQQG